MGDVYGYPRGAVGRDLAAVGCVAVGLTLLHFGLPPGVRERFAFHHGAVDPVTPYTSAFVHADGRHLATNVSGYLAAAVTTYGLCLRSDDRRWFLSTFAVFLSALPVAVNLTSYALLSARFPGIDPVTRGFSGVGAGFVGFLFVALVAALRAEYDRRVARWLGLGLWLLVLVEVAVIHAGRLALPVAGLATAGWALCLRGIASERGLPDADAVVGAIGGEGVQFTFAAALLAAFVVVLFPPDLVENGAVTDVFAHTAGFCYGVLGAVLTSRAGSTETV